MNAFQRVWDETDIHARATCPLMALQTLKALHGAGIALEEIDVLLVFPDSPVAKIVAPSLDLAVPLRNGESHIEWAVHVLVTYQGRAYDPAYPKPFPPRLADYFTSMFTRFSWAHAQVKVIPATNYLQEITDDRKLESHWRKTRGRIIKCPDPYLIFEHSSYPETELIQLVPELQLEVLVKDSMMSRVAIP